ncbi:MAG: rhamnulose-1-phosphate aldolase [Clostridia bacterium]|nr:rhamnulose-1-phosphate aldolase [Clostridia bacterium]
MKIIESNFYNEALRFIRYGCEMGWHERNAGNISLRLLKEEVDSVSEDFAFEREWVSISYPVPEMANEFIFTTATGSYFIDIQNCAETKFCICQISGDGGSYRVVWGGTKPTSELCGHLMSLGQLRKRSANRAVYHCHPANTVALTYVLPKDDKSFSEALWESETECAFVFSEGVGLVPFFVPGSLDLAIATSEKIQKYNAVIWSFHGVFASGETIGSAFGLAHAIEKAAEIKIKVLSTGLPVLNTISTEEQKKTANTYGYKLNEFKD